MEHWITASDVVSLDIHAISMGGIQRLEIISSLSQISQYWQSVKCEMTIENSKTAGSDI